MTKSGEQHAERDAPRADEDERDPGDQRLGAEPPPLGPTAEGAVAALFEAGPEAAEHLLKAAQELLLAAKAVVDAGERAVEAHRSAADAAETTAPATATGEEPPARRGRVRHIDLA
jgi:hypothetical protein